MSDEASIIGCVLWLAIIGVIVHTIYKRFFNSTGLPAVSGKPRLDLHGLTVEQSLPLLQRYVEAEKRDQLARIQEIEDSIERAEALFRRHNILFYGFPGQVRESTAVSQDLIRNFISETLKVEDAAAIMFDTVYRLRTQISPQPIVAKFMSRDDTERVFATAKAYLNDNPTTTKRVGRDFIYRVRAARRLLIPFMVKAREEGKTAFLLEDKLVIDEVMYRYDDDRQTITQCSPPSTSQDPNTNK